MPSSLSSSTPSLSSDEQYIIRGLTSADVAKVRALHSSLSPSSRLSPTFFHQLLTHPTRLCLLAAPLSDPEEPIAFITASLHVRTTDLSLSRGAAATPEVHVLTLGVLPAHRRHHLATRLLHEVVVALRVHAKTAAHLPPVVLNDGLADVRADFGTQDAQAWAFWKGMGLEETEAKEPWRQGWQNIVRVEGRIIV